MKLVKYFALATLMLTTSNSLMAAHKSATTWKKIDHVAQYGGADWSNLVKKIEGITVEEAKAIASKDPQITHFFYTNGNQMALGGPDHIVWRVFHQGDAVFFSGEPSWGEAGSLADGYVRN